MSAAGRLQLSALPLLACIAVHSARAADPPETLRPPMIESFAQRIEWAEPIGDSSLALATADGVVRVYQLAEGTLRARAALPASPGVRWAGLFRETLFCLDRDTLYALRLPASAAAIETSWSWTRGERSAQTRPAAADPELLPEPPRTAITSAGLLLIDADGRLALFDQSSDQPVRRGQVTGVRRASIVADPACADAVLVWHDGRRCRGAWIRPTQDGFGSSEFDLDETSPIWITLTGPWLVAIWPDRALAVSRAADRHQTTFSATVSATATTSAVWSPPPRATPTAPTNDLRALRLVTSDGSSLVQYDLLSGARLQPATAPVPNELPPTQIVDVKVTDDAAVVLDLHTASAMDLATHTLRARLGGMGGTRVLSADITGGRLRAVFGSEITSEARARWSYAASTLGPTDGATIEPTGTVPRDPAPPTSLEVGALAGLVRIVWLTEGFVICGSDRLVGFIP